MSAISYARGFCKAAEAAGVDPVMLVKLSEEVLPWGAVDKSAQDAIQDVSREMPPQNPAVPGIGAPPTADRTVPPSPPPEVKTPAPPVPPQHKSELPEAGADKKFDWRTGYSLEAEKARRAWFRTAAERIERMQAERIKRTAAERRNPLDRLLKGSYR